MDSHISKEKLRSKIVTINGKKTLNLSERDLLELPEAVLELTELNKLDLSGNKLKTIPENVGKLNNIRILDVRGNQLCIFPASLTQLKKLEWLYISNNKLTTISDAIGEMVALEELDLSYNQLTVLNPAIKQLKKLKALFVYGNPFTVEGMRSVAELQDRRVYRVYSDLQGQIPDRLEAQLAYERALVGGYVTVNRGRILLIGQDQAGKTSLKKSLLGLPFDSKEQSTEGIEVDPSKCKIDVDQAASNWQSIGENKPGLLECSEDVAKIMVEKMVIPDHSVRKMYMQSEDFDEEDKDESSDEDFEKDSAYISPVDFEEGSFDDYKYGRKKVEETGDYWTVDGFHNSGIEHSEDCILDEPQVIIDVTQPPDTVKHVHQWLKYIKGKRIKSGVFKEESYVSMDMWDFAGQHLYYASHPIFLSRRALYILVHNLSKPLDATAEPCMRQGSNDVKLENPNNATNMENLLSWLATVHGVALATDDPDDDAQHKLPYLRPPVFIVGTHADKPVEDIEVIKKQIQERISGMEYEKHVVRPLFCVDNTERPNLIKEFIQKFQKQIGKHKTGKEEGKADGIKELQNKILEVLRQEPYMGEKIPVRWFLFEKVIEALVAKQIYHRNLQQLKHYAKKDCFMKDAKEFESMISFYHGLGMIIKHRSTVVLKAQWLIDLFKQLITIPPFNKQTPLFAKYWQELEASGILSMEHVDHVFSSFITGGIVKADILDMMERFGLIAKFSASPTTKKYFVPAQLKSSPVELCNMELSLTDPCPLYLLFVHGFVPHGLFLQLVSRCIRWCSETWATHQPTLYQNGAWFIIGKDVHDFVLICKTGFVKVTLRQRKAQSDQVEGQNSVELATLVRKFLEDTLKNLSQEMPYLRGMKYRLCVACPYCHQGAEETCRACSDQVKTTCTHKDCFHLIDANEGRPDICKRKPCNKVAPVCGLKKWFLNRRSQGLSSSNVAARSHDEASEINPKKSATALKVALLGSEWSSSMGGLSTINRQLAILLAKHAEVDVTLLVPQSACSEVEKRMASSHNVSIQEAKKLTGFSDPLEWLSFPPRDLDIDFVLGHGAKLGKQAQVIRESHSCKWIQVVHTAPEQLGMHKTYPMAISKGEDKSTTEVDLCKLADAVVAVGPKLTKAYSSYLRSCEKHQDIIQLTPSTFSEFSDLKQAAVDVDIFKVLTFGRGDQEDFSLKGYDISARAIVELKDRSYHLTFVGAPEGKQDEVAKNLLKSGIDKNQLTVRKFKQSKERLKELFCEVDLCIMPSRTEGFGLTALEALSAGLPILVSGNSGFGEALRTLPCGKSFVVESEDPREWAKAIAGVRQKERSDRLRDIQQLKSSYEENFSWEKQCDSLVEKMWDIVHASKRRDTSFRARQAEVIDTSTKQPTVVSLLTPSSFDRIIQKLKQMQLDASKVESRADLSLKLRKIASDRGFRISDNKGLGNCMFYALSEQLAIVKGIKILHGELRQTLVQYLRNNPKLPDGTDLFHFVHGHQTWTEYLVHMEQDGAWGDHVILCAAANYFETCIRVVSSLSHSNDVIITPHCPVDESKPLVLGHVHEVHYVSLQAVQERSIPPDGDNKEQNLPGAAPYDSVEQAQRNTKEVWTATDTAVEEIAPNTSLKSKTTDGNEETKSVQGAALYDSTEQTQRNTKEAWRAIGTAIEVHEKGEVPYYTSRKDLTDEEDGTVDTADDLKTLIKRGKIGGEEDTWHLREAGASIKFCSGTVQQTVPFTCRCLLWNPRTISLPIASDEILVSSVIELSHDGPPNLDHRESAEELSFTVALFHSAPDLEGYEVVIKQLTDQENNGWEELKTKNIWHGSGTSTLPRWLFPCAQAVSKKSRVSSFAAIWRPKSFTFSSGTAVGQEFTCVVPDFPDVSVQIPQSCVPVNQDFCVTIKVQEFPSSELKGEGGLVGPALYITGPEKVTLIAPVTIRIPLTLRKGKQELTELCPGELRILHCESLVEPHYWKDITDQLDEPPRLLDGKVQFQVKHFSGFRPVKLITSLLRSASSFSEFVGKLSSRSRPQHARFFSCLCETHVPGHFGLKLFCYPPTLQSDVDRQISACIMPYTGEGNSYKPVCDEEEISVSLSEAIKPQTTDERNALNSVRFRVNKIFDTGGEVCLKSESVPGVKFFDQRGELLCNLTIVLASQACRPFGVALHSSEIQRAQEMPPSKRNIQSSVDVDSLHELRKKLHVTLLATEWCSAKGGLSTINRELAKQFSSNPNVKVTLFAPPFECRCKEKDKAEAFKHDINIEEADGKMTNSTDPLDWLAFPPEKIHIDVVIGHGWKLGWQAEKIRRSHLCKWVQMVHTCPEELAMHKICDTPLPRGEEKHASEVSLCEKADLVVTMGPKLKEAIAQSLRPCEEEKTVLSITPGVFSEFKSVKTPLADLEKFYILVFGRCDLKDLSIKGYDIAAKAVANLCHRSYHLTIMGATADNHQQLVDSLVSYGIPDYQLTVRKFCTDREILVKSFPQFDLVLMPSRTEGFGLTALEALSAGIPILVSGNSGFAEALKKVEFGELYIVEDFKNANEWAKKIEVIRQKERRLRLKEIRKIRKFYEKKYSWESQCQELLATMTSMVYAEPLRPKLEVEKKNIRWNAPIMVAVVVCVLAAFISLLLHRGWIGSLKRL